MNILLLALAATLSNFVQSNPQVIPLNNYNSDQISTILTVEAGGKLYLASNDDPTLLQKIKISTGSVTTNLDQLLDIVYMTIADKLTIQSGNDAATTALLTGYLYVTTASQANDNSFLVTVVNETTTLIREAGISTTVVLNVQTAASTAFDNPQKTTAVTKIQQSANTNLNFHYGVPDNNWGEVTINQFFENPQRITNYDSNGTEIDPTIVLFTDIQPLQINLPYWYITSNGPYTMVLDNTYMNIHTQNVQSTTSTGLIVITDAFQPQTVTFTVDPTKQGNTGLLLSTFLEYPLNLTLTGPNGDSKQTYDSTTIMQHGQFVSDFAATKLAITSAASKPGVFYCQYFVFTTDMQQTIPPTSTSAPSTIRPTIPSTSTTTVATTTKSSRSLSLIKLSVMFLMYILCRQ